jgi:YegS/Rv2252/BmrU family lipid kinase
VRACVIFNPAAKGQRAARFSRCLDAISVECVLKKTSAPGEARKLAADAVRDGFETIIAAGGDGTLNEVLNGLGDAPDGFARARLGILPLGTVNVFARELGFPTQPDAAWLVLQRARESRIDLGCIEYHSSGTFRRVYFAQLAGAGLDARAIELVNWPLKKSIGPVAYVIAGLQALFGKPAEITVSTGDKTVTGQLVLIGNGRLYGGPFRIFPEAGIRDGFLDVCVFPRANWWTLLRYGLPLLLRKELTESAVVRLRAESLRLSAPSPTPFEIDGEMGGHLPATVSVKKNTLRILVPG